MCACATVCLRAQLHARELSLAEVRTSAEVLQAASAQMQVRRVFLSRVLGSSHVPGSAHNPLASRRAPSSQSQLGSSKRELESRCLELSRQLEEARHEVVQASSGAASSQQALQDATSQLKESLTRTDFLRHEREKLVKVLQAEQAALAEARKELDAARAQVRGKAAQQSSDEDGFSPRSAKREPVAALAPVPPPQAAAAEASRAEVEALFRQQIEGLTRENEARVASVTKQ